MVGLEGEEHVRRLRQRVAGEVDFDPDRDVDFLVHNRQAAKKRHCPMLDQRLAIIEAARHSITIEMAYLGDKRFTRALLRALARGVEITLVTAAQADILGNVNRAVCNTLLRQAGSKTKIVLLPRMVHSKVVVVDHTIADIGSANFTPLSHGIYEEINLYAVDEGLARDIERVIMLHADEGEEAGQRLGYRRFSGSVERVILTYQSRGTARLGRSHLSRSEIVSIKREDREIARRAKRQGRQFKRRERENRKQERISAKHELRRGKREQRESKKSERTEARRVSIEAKRSAQEQKRDLREAKRNLREDKRRVREHKRAERLGTKRQLRADKRELRSVKRQRRKTERTQQRAHDRVAKNAHKKPRHSGRPGTNPPIDGS